MDSYLDQLKQSFLSAADPDRAIQMKAYMRDQFEFLGMPSPLRKEISRPFLAKANLPVKAEAFELAEQLWMQEEREYQYFALDLLLRYSKLVEENDITMFETLVLNKSWWDTIDVISPKLMGNFFKVYPEKREHNVNKWIDSGNIWLQRSAVLFQLNYKDQIDKRLLESIIERLEGSKEFFINKAIGWILRNYSMIDPQWVVDICHRRKLSSLSFREGTRRLPLNFKNQL